MTPTLRPMSLGEILDRTFQIYRARFLSFVAIASIPALAMRLVYLIDFKWIHVHTLLRPFREPGISMWGLLVELGFFHIAGFFSLLIEPAYVKLTACFVLEEKCSICSSLQFAAARWRGYLGLVLSKISIELLAPEILAAGVMLVAGVLVNIAGGLDGAALLPALLIILVPASGGFALFLWLGACLSLAIPAASLENLAANKSLRRSWGLTKSSRTRIWLTWLILFIAGWATLSAMQYTLRGALGFLGREFHIAAAIRLIYLPIFWVMNSGFGVLLGPIYPIALTLFYYDQRIRHEGYDIEQMMVSAGLNPAATAANTSETAPQPIAHPFAQEDHA